MIGNELFPRKQRRRSLWSDILLCFLGCGQALTSTHYPTRPELFFCCPNPTRTIFQNFRVPDPKSKSPRFLSLKPASRSMRVALRSDRGLPWILMAGCLEVKSRVASRSVQVASRSHVRVASRSQGTNFGTKIFNFRCFFVPSDRFTTPEIFPKYEVWAINFFCGRIPFIRS